MNGLVAANSLDESKYWFSHADFGMFVHWGLYAIPAGVWKGVQIPWFGEWIMHTARIPIREYEALAKGFNPTGFDARSWVRMAEDAGMKYLVFTAKHHEGFAMYRSKADRYNILEATPFKRDPIEELAEACRGTDVKLALYYSQAQDWHEAHAGNGPNDDAYGNTWDFPQGTAAGFSEYMERKSLPQITELLTLYGPIAMIWFDNPIASFTREHAENVKRLVRSLQPQCLISARIGHGMGDIRGFGDNQLPEQQMSCPTEACVTMNDTWGYKLDGGRWKSVPELVRIKEKAAMNKCNLLLNVGPMSDGRFPPEAVERLACLSVQR
jgi:alpha-L-fucosidase